MVLRVYCSCCLECNRIGYGSAGVVPGEFTYNTCIASLHTYLGGRLCLFDLVLYAFLFYIYGLLIGLLDVNLMLLVCLDVEDTHHRTAFLDGGTVLNLPLFYLQGILSSFMDLSIAVTYLLNMLRKLSIFYFICILAVLLL